MALLEARGVRKAFGATEVLHGIDLSVERGDVVAALGPSGSGKTTLLRCLNFLTCADAGTMPFGGATYDLRRATSREVADVRRKTGFVFQTLNLFRNKAVLGNVTEGLVVAQKMGRTEAEEVACRCLAEVGMDDRALAWPIELSGGQQQRVAIARPRDEPRPDHVRRADVRA